MVNRFTDIYVYCINLPLILIMSTQPSFILTVLLIIILCHAEYHSLLSPSKSSDHATDPTEFGLFNIIPISFFFISSWLPISHIPSTSLLILLALLLSGDIQPNPGPVSTTFASMFVRSTFALILTL